MYPADAASAAGCTFTEGLMVRAESSPAGLTTLRTVHVHPTRACNLACQHCYSHSGPGSKHAAPVEELVEQVTFLHEMGYQNMSVSGGEPFVYQGLAELLTHAKNLGMTTSVITNGTLMHTRRAREALPLIDAVAISLDGPAEHHEALRGSGTMKRVQEGIRRLQADGVHFGIAHCVTARSLSEVPWLVEYAASVGALGVQLHPLTQVGRAREMSDTHSLDEADMARLYLVATLLSTAYEGEVGVHVDLAPATILSTRIEAWLVHLGDGGPYQLSELVSPLIIDEHTKWSAFCYGSGLAVPKDLWMAGGSPRRFADFVKKVIQRTHSSLAGCDEGSVRDWYAMVRRAIYYGEEGERYPMHSAAV